MIPPPSAARTLKRLIVGMDVNGELATIRPPWRPIADHLIRLAPEARPAALEAAVCALDDPAGIVAAVAGADPEGEPSEEDAPAVATLDDVRRLFANTKQPWPGWLASGVLNGLAAEPGTGKTILSADLARRLWFGLPWPDNQPNPFPAGTRTLWVPGDRHFQQLCDLAAAYGLPGGAIAFNAEPGEPTAGLNLDDPAELAALSDRIALVRPGLVIVDTVGMTTGRNLCRPEDARAYFAPLMEMAAMTESAFLCLTHLSKGGDALGRRIVEKVRLLWKLSHPDPEGEPDRRRLWVDKTYAKQPPPLGMRIGEAGCEFDFNPPTAPEPGRAGRPPDARKNAERFIRDALAKANDRKATDLCAEWERDGGHKSAFWRARDEMVKAGELACEGKPLVMHLNPPVARGG